MTPPIPCRFRLVTSVPDGHSALAIIDIDGDVDAAVRALGMKPVGVGSPALRDLLGVDTGVVVRWTDRSLSMMPHAGPIVVSALCRALADRGFTPDESGDPRLTYPEASSLLEARMLDALARAASPLAVDLLLAQPSRWAAVQGPSDNAATSSRDRTLRRLIDPPTVVVLGRPNIGKSTLLNALAQRSVAIVHDAPGTTRDTVGCVLDMGGLVVRWLDAPGLEPDTSRIATSDARAQALALAASRSADLVIIACDATRPAPDASGYPSVLRVGLRADLGPPSSPCDVLVAAGPGMGLQELTEAVRERLVPRALIDDPSPWVFWNTSAAG